MKIIKVKDVVGATAVGPREGATLREAVDCCLSDGHSVTVDFEGVKVFASPFFNYGLAALLKTYGADDLRRRLRVTNLDGFGKRILKRSMDQAKIYYAQTPSFRRRLDGAVSESLTAS